MTQHFDVAVIGTQNAGLLSAALLAKRNHRVTILDHGENTHSYYHRGIHLPLTPDLTPSFDGPTAFRKVHQELGIIPKFRSAISPQVPCFQMVMPPHRIDVRGDREAFMDEIRREFPESADSAKRFFDRLTEADRVISGFLEDVGPFPPDGLRDSWRQGRSRHLIRELDAPFNDNRIFDEIPTAHPLRDILFGLLVFLSNLTTETPSSLHAIRLIARYFQGASRFLDPLGGLHHLLQDTAAEVGASFHRGASIRELEVDNRRVSRIVFSDGRRPITADHVVYNAWAPLSNLLKAERAHNNAVQEEKETHPQGTLVVCNMIVRKEVIPCGMGDALFLLNARPMDPKHEPYNQPIFLRRYPVEKREAKSARGNEPQFDPDRETLSIALPVRADEIGTSPEQLAAVRTQLTTRLQHVIPYLDEYITDMSFPLETDTWDAEGDESERLIDPRSFHPLHQSPQRPWLGVAARKPKSSLKNLLYSGWDVLPGLGVEGTYMTALKVADTITKLAQKKTL